MTSCDCAWKSIKKQLEEGIPDDGTLLKMISVLSHVVTGTLHENSDSLINGNESRMLESNNTR